MHKYLQLSQLSQQLSQLSEQLHRLLVDFAPIEMHPEGIRRLETVCNQLHTIIKGHCNDLVGGLADEFYVAILHDAFQNLREVCNQLNSFVGDTSTITTDITNIADKLIEANQFVEKVKREHLSYLGNLSGVNTSDDSAKSNVIVFPLNKVQQSSKRTTLRVRRYYTNRHLKRFNGARTKRLDDSWTTSSSDEQQTSRHNINRNILYICHARPDDDQWRDRIRERLKPYEKSPEFKIWDTTETKAGQDKVKARQDACEHAKVAVLLLSHHLCGDDRFTEEELPQLCDAATNDGLIIIPVIVSRCSYKETHSKLEYYEPAHNESHPLDSLGDTILNNTLGDICAKIVDAMRS